MRKAHTVDFYVSVLKWTARLFGGALFLVTVLVAIGEGGPPNPFRQPLPVAIQLALLLVIVVGLVVAWRWEIIGALATLLARVGFYLVNLVKTGWWPGGWFIPLLAIPPVFHLSHASLLRRPSLNKP